MDPFSFLGGAHISFLDDLYQKYLSNPDSVEPSWRAFFQGYDFSRSEYGEDLLEPENGGAAVPDEVRKEFQVINLIHAYRLRGHLFTRTNPVRARRTYSPTLDHKNFGLTDEDLDRSFMAGTEVGLNGPATLREIITHLEAIYCQSIGVEFMYIRNPEVLDWIKSRVHINDNQPNFNPDQKKRILHKLNEAVSFENFLNTKFVGQKRFSIEGAESLIPALDFLIERAADLGVKEFVMGMAHRGRLNVLANIFGKPKKEIFSEFEGKEFEGSDFDGDVKYHLGYSSSTVTVSGKDIRLNLAPNPSHLEAVDPVVEGIARARINHDHGSMPGKVLPVLIHGDAAVAAQGVVYEVVQMETLDGYKTGGTIHIVINNQVGFTTNYLDARSSTYCTDVAKVVLAPVLHVNGDDVEAVCHAILFAVDYRQRYNKDIFIDLLCYRKYGHNEGDEPRFTQPLLYKAIARHPNPREIYNKRLLQQGVIGESIVKEMEKEFKAMLEENFDESKKIRKNVITPFLEADWKEMRQAREEDFERSPETGVSRERLQHISRVLTTLPEGKKFFNKIQRLMEDRRKMVEETNRLDWGMAELMAYGTLLMDGHLVRISGEDVERGTFSHRHAVVKMEDSEEEYSPLQHLSEDQGRFSIYNSLLSEYAVLGFDYGYAMASPNSLVIWEAQFGDFANGAQIIIDQFLAAAEDKWKNQNSLCLFLPHGYEGQGAEHSSARLERFLQLCAQLNMQVVNITTPANFFHAIRRQLARPFRKPLVVMTPKSLLRHPRCVSGLEELENGRFLEVIDDASVDPKKVKKVVVCSGKLYYELLEHREEHGYAENTALIRMEQLYPLPLKQMEALREKYGITKTWVWAQEEPANMGSWGYILMNMGHFNFRLVAPRASASPASGSHQAAHALQHRIIKEVFEL